jgi:hypothetical protein
MIEKPTYTPSKRAYICEIRDGLRFTKQVNHGEETLDSPVVLEQILPIVLSETRTFFSKPLKDSDIRAKLVLHAEPALSADEHTMEYTMRWVSLEITQSHFLCLFTVDQKQRVAPPPPLISFEEVEEAPLIEEPDLETIPLDSTEPLSIANARLVAKQKIRRARLRAAKAILRSEQLTKEFVAKWGEPDSDWESDDETSLDSD